MRQLTQTDFNVRYDYVVYLKGDLSLQRVLPFFSSLHLAWRLWIPRPHSIHQSVFSWLLPPAMLDTTSPMRRQDTRACEAWNPL